MIHFYNLPFELTFVDVFDLQNVIWFICSQGTANSQNFFLSSSKNPLSDFALT